MIGLPPQTRGVKGVGRQQQHMTELEIERRCPGQKEMEKECYEEDVQPNRKTDYKLIIIITASK